MQTFAVEAICVLAIVLSAKSVIVLGRAAPWTAAGWWLTIVYLVAVIAKAGWAFVVPAHLEYAVLVALTIAFVIAGIRDERQAEPWWWPTHRGPKRSEKPRTT
jgi:hypothetical protein